MELATEPDTYSPCIDTFGNYIDKVPSFATLPYGLRCPCGGRKEKYVTPGAFQTHTKTKTHQKWLAQLTANKANYYKENEDNKETIHNQKIIIARLERELQTKIRTIDYLTSQLVAQIQRDEQSRQVGDLLEFD
jgi:hypothetical protein